MKQLKRCLALALAFAVCVTMIPERTFAMEISEAAGEDDGTLGEDILPEAETSENDKQEPTENENALEGETQKLSKNETEGGASALSGNGSNAGADTSAGDIVSEEESKEDLYATQNTEEFTVLTVGQELHHTATGLKYYRFKPEESGIYYFTMESKKAGDTFSANISKTIHSKGEKTFLNSYFQQITEVEKVDRIMCLNRDETYEFYCWPDNYADSTNLDISLMMKKVEITGVEAVTPPTVSSSERFDGTGMKVKINFKDGAYVSSDVIDNTYAGGSSILALDWNNVAYNPTENISKTLTVYSVNGTEIDYGAMPPTNEEGIISGLLEGEYPIELGISHYIQTSSETKNYKFETTFQVTHNNLTEMEVTPEEVTYTEKFAQSLKDISLKVTYQDGTTETVRTNDASAGSYVNQYLTYGEFEMPDGTKQPYPTTEIDTYLDNGGTVGKADVTVEYKGQKTTYEITILENPYSGISKIEPSRTIYYADTGYKDREHNADFAGDTITRGNVGKVSLSRKDGEADVSDYIYNMPGYSDYENSSYVKYGLKKDDKYYKDIEAYLAAGGSTGTNPVTVTYINDFEKTYDVDIRDNPYKRIEIAQEPTKTKYEYNDRGGSLELDGLVLHAYKEDGTYDTFTHGEENTSVLGLEWSGYFHAYSDKFAGKNSYGGYSDYFRCYPGKHTAYVVFMGLSATYEVEVAEEVVEEKAVMTELNVLKNPARNIFYINEKDYTDASAEDLLAAGLEIELKDSKGWEGKYKYGQYFSDSNFNQWSSYNLGFDTSQIDWTTPGTYTYTVFYRKDYDGKVGDVSADLKKDITITIADSPIESFTFLREPEKKTFYAYERTTGFNKYLYGMAYKITFDDGSVYADTVRSTYTASLSFTYRGNTYSVRQSWARTSSENLPALGENTIKFTIFGDAYQMEGFAFEEDPITSIEFVKYPQKQIYMGNNLMDNKIDLYGAELKIVYADGTSETAQITEHGPSAVIGKYGKEVTSRFEYHMPDSGGAHVIPYVQVSYMGKTAEFLADFDMDSLDVSSASEITDGGQTDVITLSGENRYQVLSFTPKETGIYYFYCIDAEVKDTNSNSAFVVGLYGDGNWLVSGNNAGTWDFPCYYWGELEAGKTYYYIFGIQGNDEEAKCQCYLSSKVSNHSTLGEVSGIEVIGTDYNIRYDYELENTYSPINTPGAYMSGTHYKLSYNNAHNWTEEKYVVTENRMSSVNVGSNEYMYVEWEHKKKDDVTGIEDPFMPQVRDDNALVYTYKGEEVAKIPAKVGAASPVESITINNNPWENTYEYQSDYNMEGLSLTIHYTDASGKTDKTVVWDSADSNYGLNRKQVDGYSMEAIYSDTGKTDSNGVKIYNLSVSYMGAEDVKEVSYKQNPVAEFEVIEEPQKKQWYPFDEKPDIYGMKFKVKFRDNTEQTVEASEHDKTAALPDGTEKVTGSMRTDNGKNALYLTGMGHTRKVMEYESAKLPVDVTGANNLMAGQTKYAVLDGDNYYQVYAFTAEEEGEYTFAVTSPVNRKLFLYSDKSVLLGTADSTLSERELQRNMTKGESVYLAVVSLELKCIGSIAATVTEKDIQKTEITDVNLAISDIPVGGELLSDVTITDSNAGYAIDSYQWYGDEDENGKADFATSHRLQIILVPDKQSGFTADANVSLSVASTGQEAENTARLLGADGKLTLYYTFPYTECKIDFPQIDGYTLDTTGNDKDDRVIYGEDYTFRYINAAGEADKSLIVKANGNLIPLTNGSYTLENVTENVAVIVKSGNVTVGKDETLLKLYNKSTDPCDVIVGKRNLTIKDNTNGENTLPVLPSYAGGSTDFFYGWYLDKDASLNGRGTRFTSVSKLLEDAYGLYSKWGSGFFHATIRGKTLGYQVLSFDEYNNMKVQVTGAGAGSKSVYAMKSYGGASRDGSIIEDSDGVIEIPASLNQYQMSLQEDLELDIERCQVVAVADHAFANTEDVKNIVLPDTIESIGEGAFANCALLEEINIPKGVTEIGDRAFEGCTSLQEVVIPSTVTSLNAGTFRGCQDLTVVLPDTIRGIDKDAFEDVKNVTIICSSELAETDTVESVKGPEITVRTVDIELGGVYGAKIFTYGDAAETLMACVKVDGVEDAERTLEWNVTDTDAFTYTVDGNSITVTPKRATRDTDDISITVTDKATHMEKSVLLKTNAADLSKKNENGESLYMVEIVGRQVYSGTEICPDVVVKKNTQGSGVISASDYNVFYSDNIEAGTGKIVIKGKGNYTGNLSQTFTIDKAEQRITASDLVKSTADFIFVLGAKTNGGGKLSYTSSNPQVAVIDEHGMVRICGEGVTEIGIRAAETKNYKESELKTIKLTVNAKKDFLPSVTAPESELKVAKTAYTMALTDKGFTLDATAKTAIQYESSNEKVAVVSVSGHVIFKNCGKTVITVRTKDAQKKVTVIVVPGKVKAGKITSKKSGELKVSWKSQKGASGYVVEYSTDKNFKKKVAKKTVKSGKKTSVTLKKLKKGKKYYVKILAYTKVGSKKICGKASKIQNKKVKK